MVERFSGHPHVAWLRAVTGPTFALALAVLPALVVLGPLSHQQTAAALLGAVLVAAAAAFGMVVAGLNLPRPHTVPVQARRRTQAPPAWSVTRVPRTPRRPRAPGGR